MTIQLTLRAYEVIEKIEKKKKKIMKKNNCKRRRKTVNSGITRDRRHQGVNEFENREISPRSQLES